MSEQKSISNAERFLKAGARKPRIEHTIIPALSMGIHVREITTAERDTLDGILAQGKDNESRAIVIAACLCNEDGTPMFPSTIDPVNGKPKFADGVIDRIKDMVASATEPMFKFACKMNGIGQQQGVDPATGK